jgi:hypothetical protein
MLKVFRVQDWEGVRRIIGGRDQPPAVIAFEDRGIAIADEDLRMDVLRQQRAPGEGCRRVLRGLREDVRNARSEIPRKFAVEGAEVLLRRGRDDIGLRPDRAVHREAETVVHGLGDNRERRNSSHES